MIYHHSFRLWLIITKNYCTNFGIHGIMSITKDDKCLS
nr:MAG TPA: hypothetical protein [Caudoviricetes sp.]